MNIYEAPLISSEKKPISLFPFEQDPYTCFILEKNPSPHIPYTQNAPNSFFDNQQPSINPPPFSYTQPMNTSFDLAKYDASLSNLMYIGQAIKIILAAYALYTIIFTEKSTANNAYTREHNYLPQHAFDYSHLPLECRKYERYCNIPLRDIVTRPSDAIMHMPEERLTQQDNFHKNVYLSQQINIASMLAAQRSFRQKSYILHTLLAQSTQGSILSKLRARLDLMQFSYHKDHKKSFKHGIKQIYASWFDKDGNLLPINNQSSPDIYAHFKDFIAHYPLQEEDIHCASQEHLERYGNIEMPTQERGSCKLAQQTQTRYNTALRELIRLADTHASLSEIYAYKTSHAAILNTQDAQELYDYIIQQRFATMHTAASSEYNFCLASDPLYATSKQDLLLLRKEYADGILKNFAPLQNIAAQDIFAVIPERSSELISALQDTHQYAAAIDTVLKNLEKNHPECFLNNGILSIFADDSYVAYMRNESTDPELIHIINYSLLMQHHDASPEGVTLLAKKTVRLARLAQNESHINHTNRTILAHTSYELLKNAKTNDLMLHIMTDQARKVAHKSAFEKQEYMDHFYQQRKEAFDKTEQEKYAQYARKYNLHEDSVMLLCKEDLCPLDFENLNGTNLQHELMAETIEGLDTLAIVHKHAEHYGNCGSSFQNTVSTLTLFAQAAQEFNSECDINASMHCINTLHSGIEIIVEGARGAEIGLENLGSMIAHPIDTGKSLLNFTKSIAWALQETARYCLFDRTFDEKRARETESQAQNFLEGIANYIYYSCTESSPGDYARIATEQYTMLKAPGALLDAVSSATNMAKNISLSSITESEIGLFLKKNIISEPYLELASEITQEIKTGISEIAESGAENINNSAINYKALLQKLITQQKVIINKIFSRLNLDVDFAKIRTFIDENLISKLPTPLKSFLEKEKIALQDVKIKISHFFETSLGIKENKIVINGLHHDFGNYIESCKEFLFAKKTILQDDFYEVLVSCNIPEYASMVASKQKTFFPAHWTRLEVIDFCLQHLSEAIITQKDPTGIMLISKVKDNLGIIYIYDENKRWFSSIYPTKNLDLYYKFKGI